MAVIAAVAEATTVPAADSVSISTTSSSWANISQYAPSALDLILAGPRIVKGFGSFILITIPEAVDSAINAGRGQRMIPSPTGALQGLEMATTVGPTAPNHIAQAGADILEVLEGQTASNGARFTLDSIRGLGNVFHYATSKWAWGCILMAVILNRTQVYASTRRHLVLGWKIRLLLRLLPIISFLLQGVGLLRSIQCQTSPDFAELRWGNSSRTSELLFHEPSGGFLHTISSTLLLGSSDADSCHAINMVPAEVVEGSEKLLELKGSLSRLFPLFLTFCGSQFVEALSATVQGRPVAPEVGMSLFEHSLAFAEADAAAITTQLGWGPFVDTKSRSAKNSTSDMAPGQFAVKLKSKTNAPPEVLLVGALSAGNHLTSQILGVFDMQKRFRLYNTGFWGLCFISAIVWSFMSFSIDEAGNHSLLRFPTVCIVGFIPHIMVVIGILICGAIYSVALLLSALAPTSQQEAERPFKERLLSAHENLQTNIPVPNFARPSHELDAYSALIKIGFNALTVASEAVYLNESREVNVKQMTWLEEDRWAEMEDNGARWLGPNFRTLDDPSDGASIGLVATTENPMDLLMRSSSGYSRERIPHKSGKGKAVEKGIRDGVGAAERSGRWIMAMDFFTGILRLMAGWISSLIMAAFATLGWQVRPSWLVRWTRRPGAGQKADEARQRGDPGTMEFWMVNEDGEMVLPTDGNVDVENEMRKRQREQIEGSRRWSDADEQNLASNLYGWWKNNGWWGEIDTSGQFEPTPTELYDDTTSVVSMSTNSGEDGCESDNNYDGRCTPTQRDYRFSRDSTPASVIDNPLSVDRLSRLLNPQSPEERAEATALSLHLSSDKIVTRSRFREMQDRQRAQVLTHTRNLPKNFRPSAASGKLTPQEEEQILEHLIISRRSFHNATASKSNTESWAHGGSGSGAEGPQCVVCQSSPRTIIVWPCRCLSLCDDCRVQLAMNNFEKCVCCRREVGAFSRIYVP